MHPPEIYLLDNGSLRPEATLGLRALAITLSARTEMVVQPVSLLHSNKIEAGDLNGTPARVLKPTLIKAVAAGRRRFILLPLFLGPSGAITEYLPKVVAAAAGEADLQVVIADPLAGGDVNRPDRRLATILAAQVRAVIAERNWNRPKVALVDHGTPARAVNRLRDAVAAQLAGELGNEVAAVVASSMERRPELEYAFNEPLLENLSNLPEFAGGPLVAALFFLLPGRHAGPDGDVAGICDELVRASAFTQIERTPLLASHPLLIEILADRLQEALQRMTSNTATASEERSYFIPRGRP